MNAAARLSVTNAPRLRLLTMNDQDRETETDLRPPPPSEQLRDTMPPNPPLPSELEAVGIDRNDRTSVALRISSTDELIKMHGELKASRADLLEPEGAFAQLQARLLDRSQRATVAAISGLMDQALVAIRQEIATLKSDLESQIAVLRAEVKAMRERMVSDHAEHERSRAEYESKFIDQQKCLDVTTEMISELEEAFRASRADQSEQPAT